MTVPTFPPAEHADADGLVAIGGHLTPERLLAAYTRGIFPWYEEGLPVLWWSPDPRGILEFENLHISRSLRRTIRQGIFEITFDRNFNGVIEGCADHHGRGNWLTRDMLRAYKELHRLGYAHSAEAWHRGRLAGGIYGVAIGGFFSGESMFYRIPDASKVALVALVERLRRRGFVLFDLQILNPHTRSLGGTEIPRREYLRRLGEAIRTVASFA